MLSTEIWHIICRLIYQKHEYIMRGFFFGGSEQQVAISDIASWLYIKLNFFLQCLSRNYRCWIKRIKCCRLPMKSPCIMAFWHPGPIYAVHPYVFLWGKSTRGVLSCQPVVNLKIGSLLRKLWPFGIEIVHYAPNLPSTPVMNLHKNLVFYRNFELRRPMVNLL